MLCALALVNQSAKITWVFTAYLKLKYHNVHKWLPECFPSSWSLSKRSIWSRVFVGLFLVVTIWWHLIIIQLQILSIPDLAFLSSLLDVVMIILSPSHALYLRLYPLSVSRRAISRVSPPCWRRPSRSSTAVTALWTPWLFPRSRRVGTGASVLRHSLSSHTGLNSSAWSLEGLGGSSGFLVSFFLFPPPQETDQETSTGTRMTIPAFLLFFTPL